MEKVSGFMTFKKPGIVSIKFDSPVKFPPYFYKKFRGRKLLTDDETAYLSVVTKARNNWINKISNSNLNKFDTTLKDLIQSAIDETVEEIQSAERAEEEIDLNFQTKVCASGAVVPMKEAC